MVNGIEVLAGENNLENEVIPGEIIPIVIDEDIVSLSAMMMDEELYEFILSNSVIVDDVPICDEYGLIPLKAAAWRNLTEDRNNGLQVKGSDIKKHKNDVLRLSQVLIKKKIVITNVVKESVEYFIENAEFDDNTLKNIGVSLDKDTVVEILKDVYGGDEDF